MMWMWSRWDCPRDKCESERDNGEGIKVCHWRELEFLQKASPSRNTIILASIWASLLFVHVILFVWSVVDLLIAQWMESTISYSKFFYYLNWYTLWMIINSNHSTELKRRMPSPCCYLAQDFSFLVSSSSLAGIVSDQNRKENRKKRRMFMVIDRPQMDHQALTAFKF